MSIFNIAITIRSFISEDILGRINGSDQFRIIYRNMYGRRMTDEEIILHCQNADAVIAGTERYTSDVIRNIPSLKVISRVGVGLDSVDINYAEKKGITVCTTPHATISAVAEHTLALILALSRNIPFYSYEKNNPECPAIPGHMVRGRCVGVIGLGRIGREVAKILFSLGAMVQFYDPYVLASPDENWSSAPSLSHILSTSDIISLHIPSQLNDAPLIGRQEFLLMRRGVMLINTSRGSLIDEQSLIEALDDGIIHAAGLDVTTTEPYLGPLRNYPQVLITPHVASNTFESRREMEIEAVENIKRAFGSAS